MTTIYKSVHIEGKWPFKYEAPVKRTQAQRSRDNYLKRKASTMKTEDGRKLLKLPVYSMSESFCEMLNNESKSSF
jgi:hypothetical protein